jgi:phage gpG-like protein
MSDFSLTGFAAFATHMIVELDHTQHTCLERAAVIVETEAKRVIGTYDYNWTPLAPSTLANKSADTPLLETGEMRDSITHNVDSHEAMVGSDNDKAVYQELGTRSIPARSFLVGSAQHMEADVVREIGQRMHERLNSSNAGVRAYIP